MAPWPFHRFHTKHSYAKLCQLTGRGEWVIKTCNSFIVWQHHHPGCQGCHVFVGLVEHVERFVLRLSFLRMQSSSCMQQTMKCRILISLHPKTKASQWWQQLSFCWYLSTCLNWHWSWSSTSSTSFGTLKWFGIGALQTCVFHSSCSVWIKQMLKWIHMSKILHSLIMPFPDSCRFDFLLVLFSICENALSFTLYATRESGGSGVNLGFLRLLRLCKIVKILRVFRALRFFSELRLMLDCVVGSLMNCFWCFIMLLFVMYVFALLLQQGVLQHLQDRSIELSGDLQTYFSCGAVTLMTLFQSCTGGVDWSDPYKALEQTQSYLHIVFLLYVAFVFISVWNIVTLVCWEYVCIFDLFVHLLF